MRLDFRLVPNIEPEDVIKGLQDLIKRLGLSDLVEIDIKDSYTWSDLLSALKGASAL